MADYLTDRNGVVCHYCFKTIDLTALKRKKPRKRFLALLRLLGVPRSNFVITCPYCEVPTEYSYASDIKPIADIEQMKRVYQEEVTKYVEKYLDVKGDMIELLKDVAKKELLEVNNTKNSTQNQEQKPNKTLEHFR